MATNLLNAAIARSIARDLGVQELIRTAEEAPKRKRPIRSTR
jgi:hypothetical protein